MKFRGGRSRDKDSTPAGAPVADDYWGSSAWAPPEPESSERGPDRGRAGKRGERSIPRQRSEEQVDPARAAYLAEMAAAAAAAGVAGPAPSRTAPSSSSPGSEPPGHEPPGAFVPVSSPPVREVPVWDPPLQPPSPAHGRTGEADTQEWGGPLVAPRRSPERSSAPAPTHHAFPREPSSNGSRSPSSYPPAGSSGPASYADPAPVPPPAPVSPPSFLDSVAVDSVAVDSVASRTGDASTGVISAALRALVAFSHLAQPTQADIDQVMRTLAEHDDWYVPVRHAERGWGQLGFVRTLAFAQAPSTPVLNVFTDLASARLADGQPFGEYGGPVLGADLMRSLSSDLSALIVNPASPREQQWYIATGGFEIATRWGTAIAVERALAGRGNGLVPAETLIAHRYLVLLEKPTHAVAEIRLPDIGGTVAACFTAMDRFEEFVASLPPPVRPAADIMEVSGPQLFDLLRGIGAAGVVVNAGSDDQNALTREDIHEILQLR